MTTYDFAEVNGARLHYEARGEGHAVVFIHAGIANLNMWEAQIEPFSRHYQTIRYDIRGWGQSAEPEGSFSHHDDLKSLMAHLEVDSASLVGISLGAAIAVNFTLTYPEMVDSLVLVGPALGGYEFVGDDIVPLDTAVDEAYERGERAKAAELAARLWVDGPRRNADQVDAAFRATALDMIIHTFELPEGQGERIALQPPALERLAEITTPSFIIVGEYDVRDIMAIANLEMERFTDAKITVLDGTAHLPNMEKPSEFNELVLRFLQEKGSA